MDIIKYYTVLSSCYATVSKCYNTIKYELKSNFFQVKEYCETLTHHVQMLRAITITNMFWLWWEGDLVINKVVKPEIPVQRI